MEALWRLLNPLRECAWRTWPLNVNPKHSDGKCSRKYIRFIPLAPLRHAVRVHRTIYGHHAMCPPRASCPPRDPCPHHVQELNFTSQFILLFDENQQIKPSPGSFPARERGFRQPLFEGEILDEAGAVLALDEDVQYDKPSV